VRVDEITSEVSKKLLLEIKLFVKISSDSFIINVAELRRGSNGLIDRFAS
jgi:hypothetical protein